MVDIFNFYSVFSFLLLKIIYLYLQSTATASATARKPVSGGQKKKSTGPRPELTEEQKQEIREAFDLFDSGLIYEDEINLNLIKNFTCFKMVLVQLM